MSESEIRNSINKYAKDGEIHSECESIMKFILESKPKKPFHSILEKK